MSRKMEQLIQSELISMKKEIQRDISSQFHSISFRLQSSLQAIKADNEKLQAQLLKSTAEIQLLRTVLQEVVESFQNNKQTGISVLQPKQQHSKFVEKNVNNIKPFNISAKVNNGFDQRPDVVLDIEAKTQAEEESMTALEMDIIADSKKIDDGTTMSSTNLDILSRGIPHPMKSVAVKIINYAEMLLVNPEFFIKNQRDGNTHRSGMTPYSIGSCTRETLLFHDNHALDLEGLFTYQVGNTNLRLAVLFAVLNDASAWLFGLAFTPRNIETNEDLYNYISLAPSTNPRRPDVKFCWIYSFGSETTDLIAKHGSLCARVSFMPGRRVLMDVEVMQISKKSLPNEKRLVQVSDGRTLLGKTVEGIAASISEKFGCVVELTNGLNVSLEGVQLYNCSKVCSRKEPRIFIPAEIPELTRLAFYFADPRDLHGMFSYTIASTDVRLAVTFTANFGGNSFAVAFVPSLLPENLASALATEPAKWKTQPNHKSSRASDGEKVVEIRNIRARVEMTEKSRAILRVTISTF